MNIRLWMIWLQCVKSLSKAFSYRTSFYWAVAIIAGFCVRRDYAGVTSFVRALGIRPSSYQRLLSAFSSKAICLDSLSALWLRFAIKHCQPVAVNGRMVFVADGLKIPKEGRKMPAVKLCYQESQNNSKPAYVKAHSTQHIGLLVTNKVGAVASFPLMTRIHEGIKLSNRDKTTLLTKLADMSSQLTSELTCKSLLVTDAYYGSAELAARLKDAFIDLLCRLKHNAIAYQAAKTDGKPRRGRPPKYGAKVILSECFEEEAFFKKAPSPYKSDVDLVEYRSMILYWKKLGQKVKFVLCKHPRRGRWILMCTDLGIDSYECIQVYAHRYSIEYSFKQAIHSVGAFCYRFWMADKNPTKPNQTCEHPHRENEKYREKLAEKIRAYHTHITLGQIAQGIMLYLGMYHSEKVWQSFRGWIRTIRKDVMPSELIVSEALKTSYPEFLVSSRFDADAQKFMAHHFDLDGLNDLPLTG